MYWSKPPRWYICSQIRPQLSDTFTTNIPTPHHGARMLIRFSIITFLRTTSICTARKRNSTRGDSQNAKHGLEGRLGSSIPYQTGGSGRYILVSLLFQYQFWVSPRLRAYGPGFAHPIRHKFLREHISQHAILSVSKSPCTRPACLGTAAAVSVQGRPAHSVEDSHARNRTSSSAA